MSDVYYLLTSPVAPVTSARVDSPNGSVVTIGSTVRLICEAIAGDLPITFSWTGSNGVVIQPTGRDGSITITFSSGANYGNYSCTATNSFGVDTAVVRVQQPGI